ncbi:hypothetical protein PFISCL1PPCAC_4655, partial [Pristionchus fissidentatus]
MSSIQSFHRRLCVLFVMLLSILGVAAEKEYTPEEKAWIRRIGVIIMFSLFFSAIGWLFCKYHLISYRMRKAGRPQPQPWVRRVRPPMNTVKKQERVEEWMTEMDKALLNTTQPRHT